MIPLNNEKKKREQKIDLYRLKVPTADSVKYNYFINFSFVNRVPLLLCGPTGTGKTTLVKEFKNLID